MGYCCCVLPSSTWPASVKNLLLHSLCVCPPIMYAPPLSTTAAVARAVLFTTAVPMLFKNRISQETASEWLGRAKRKRGRFLRRHLEVRYFCTRTRTYGTYCCATYMIPAPGGTKCYLWLCSSRQRDHGGRRFRTP